MVRQLEHYHGPGPPPYAKCRTGGRSYLLFIPGTTGFLPLGREAESLPAEPRRLMQHLRVGFFTEVYRPVVNGVVASVDALAEPAGGQPRVYCFTPKVPGYETDGPVFRMPSLPLPGYAYRLTLPLVRRRNVKA